MIKKLKTYLLELEDITIHITQKRMRNLLIKICSPDATVKISAPFRISQKDIKNFAISKIDWIKKHQLKIRSQKRIPEPKFISGEEHNFFEKTYKLNVIEQQKKPSALINSDKIILYIKKDFTLAQKRKILDDFYRKNLKEIIPNYIKKWEEKMNLRVAKFGIKKMKTRWGTCNIRDKKIWISLELAKKPLACLEYIIVHEMVHLLERKHNKKFFSHMDKFLPNWKECDLQLKTKIKIDDD